MEEPPVIVRPEPSYAVEKYGRCGWAAYGFRNQGQCITFVETGHDSR